MSDVLFTATGPKRGRVYVPRRRSRSSRAMRLVALLLIAAGFLALIDAGITLVWQEPISALIAKFHQDHLRGTLRVAERAQPTPVERRALASISDERARIAYLAGQFERRTPNGGAVGRIVIPDIKASYVVVKGTDTGDLESGPGVYSDTRFPGTDTGTTAIAGHRTTYLAPFRHINELRAGDQIMLNMPYAHFIYTVSSQRVVEPTDVRAAVAQVGYSRLVLSACTPLFSAAKRLLVFAHLTRTVPVGAARTLPGGRAPQPIVANPGSPAVLKPLKSRVALFT